MSEIRPSDELFSAVDALSLDFLALAKLVCCDERGEDFDLPVAVWCALCCLVDDLVLWCAADRLAEVVAAVVDDEMRAGVGRSCMN